MPIRVFFGTLELSAPILYVSKRNTATENNSQEKKSDAVCRHQQDRFSLLQSVFFNNLKQIYWYSNWEAGPNFTSMHSVKPKKDCPHIAEHFISSSPNINYISGTFLLVNDGFFAVLIFLSVQLPCSTCHDRKENWICLQCFLVGCSR